MKLKLLLTLVALSFVIVCGELLYADSTVIQLTDNAYEDSLPQIKGDYVVWQGKADGDWEVYVCNIHTPESLTQITNNDYNDVSPQTDGNYVVWLGDSRSGGEVFLYDIANGTTTQITDDNRVDSLPQIADGRVVWASQEVTDIVEPGNIFLYHTATGVTQQLTNDALDDSDPRVSDEMVLWIQTDENDDSILLVYEIASGITSEAPEDFVWEDSAQTDGDLTVLTRHDGQDSEIFLRNSASGRYHQISDNDLQDTYPSISGNQVAWMAAGEIFLAEYVYLGLVSPEENASLSISPPPTFVWEGIGYNGFRVEFSGSSSFPTLGVLAFPSSEDNWMPQTSFAPSKEQWNVITQMQQENGSVYWRVEAKDAEATVSLSETRSFIIDGGSDSPTIIKGTEINTSTGDSGMDTGNGDSGPCFIGTLAR
jgi:beta propeller repeat protein